MPAIAARPPRALERTLAILRTLSREGLLCLEDVAVRTAIPRASCLRLLVGLAAAGAVERDEATLRYRARLRLVALDGPEEELRQAHLGVMVALAESLGEAVELYRIVRGVPAMIERADPPGRSVAVRARLGHIRPPSVLDACSLLLLAERGQEPPEELLIEAAGGARPQRDGEGRRAVAAVRREGVASDLAVNANGVRRHAVPIRPASGAMGGLLVVAQDAREAGHEAHAQEIRSALLRAAGRATA